MHRYDFIFFYKGMINNLETIYMCPIIEYLIH